MQPAVHRNPIFESKTRVAGKSRLGRGADAGHDKVGEQAIAVVEFGLEPTRMS